MVNDKSAARPSGNAEAEDGLLDYDEVGGLFFEVRGCRPCAFEDDAECLEAEAERWDESPRAKAEQQLLFTQLFDLLTENHVDPMSGLFHFRKDRKDLVH